MPTPLLQLSGIHKAYGPTVIVEDFNLDFTPGEFISLIGHSGCGKSTVLSMIAGLTPATSGTILLDGKTITEPGPDRGVVFQAPCLLPWFSVLDNVLLGVNQVYFAYSAAQRRELA
ncbi:MAG TPA: ATP-binding cassette domain-containing protein, partial [Acidobacteriota bacterium]|nr:ATP-binding cassette domain-containing protein [Acidobacteriota bacterium]